MSGMSRRVVITGIGVVTAAGSTTDGLLHNLCSGTDGISDTDGIVDGHCYSSKFGLLDKDCIKELEDKYLRENEKNLSRCAKLSLITSAMAVEDSKINFNAANDKLRTAVIIGTTQGDQYVFSGEDEEYLYNRFSTPMYIARRYDIHGEVFYNANACSAGNYAVCRAYDLISSGRADAAVVSSADVVSDILCVSFIRLKAISNTSVKPFDRQRDGTILSEGSASFIVEELEHALARNAPIYGEIVGYGISNDAYNIVAPDPDASGIMSAIRQALENAHASPEDIDLIALHGTGTKANDSAEIKAVSEVFGDRKDKLYGMAVKGALGHQLGAASTVALAVCAMVMKEGVVPPALNVKDPEELPFSLVYGEPAELHPNMIMNNAYAFGGSNSSVILKRWVADE